MPENLLFEVTTPLGFMVRVAETYWEIIVSNKHPVMKNREADVQKTLQKPDEIRRSRNDKNVYLFYKKKQNVGFVPSLKDQIIRIFLLLLI